MRFYINEHRFYCGVDLHTRTMYLCILDQAGQVVFDKNLPARADPVSPVLRTHPPPHVAAPIPHGLRVERKRGHHVGFPVLLESSPCC
jgi:hypothetical protein